MRRTTILSLVLAFLVPASGRAETAMTAGPSQAAGKNMLWNGTFDGDGVRPWNVGFDSSKNGKAAVANHELCVQIEQPGTQPSDIVLRQRPIAIARGHHYQLRFRTHATAPTRIRARISKVSAPYTELWAAVAEAGPSPKSYAVIFDATVDDDNSELALEL